MHPVLVVRYTQKKTEAVFGPFGNVAGQGLPIELNNIPPTQSLVGRKKKLSDYENMSTNCELYRTKMLSAANIHP